MIFSLSNVQTIYTILINAQRKMQEKMQRNMHDRCMIDEKHIVN